MSRRRYPDEVEQNFPRSAPDILPLHPRVPEGRDRATAIYEKPVKAVVLRALRGEAYTIWERTGRPVSANDIRPLLAAMGYEGDLRILGAVFNRKNWKPVGKIETGTARHAEFGATRQTILTYVPRASPESEPNNG